MKKLLLSVFATLTISLAVFAQDSSAFIIDRVSTSYVSVETSAGSNLRLTGDWTIEAWVKVLDYSYELHLVESYGPPGATSITGGIVLRLSGLSVRAYQLYDQDSLSFVNGSTTLSVGVWHHVAATLNETTQELKVYLNGNLNGTVSTPIKTLNENPKMYIGATGDLGNVNGKFEIDDVRIWNVAKTQQEIADGKQACFTGNETDLLAMYNFENRSGTTSYDATPNGNNGYIFGPGTTAERITACVNDVYSITVQGEGGVATLETNATLQMEASVLPLNANDTTYTWSVVNGTGAATISSTGLLTATAEGTVTVKATANDTSGVSGTKVITISNTPVGIKDLAFENLNVYPNPTNGIINLNVSEVLSSIRIMDLTGKGIKTFNAGEKQLNISEFTSGIYFLEIANAGKKSVIKIIKK